MSGHSSPYDSDVYDYDDSAYCESRGSYDSNYEGLGAESPASSGSDVDLPHRMRPSSIRFCQDSILSEFRDGTPLDFVVQLLEGGEQDVDDFPPIRVFLWDGTDKDFELDGILDLETHTYTCDNRRLFVFQSYADSALHEARAVSKLVTCYNYETYPSLACARRSPFQLLGSILKT